MARYTIFYRNKKYTPPPPFGVWEGANAFVRIGTFALVNS